MVVIGQGADRHFSALSRSPEVVTGSDGNASQPMVEGHRLRELRQTDIRSDEHIVDDFLDLISRHPSTDDADHVALISADQIGKSISFSLADALEAVSYTHLRAHETPEH